MVRLHPSDCEDCKIINTNKGIHGYMDYVVDNKTEYIHGPSCPECDRIGQKQRAHILRYGADYNR